MKLLERTQEAIFKFTVLRKLLRSYYVMDMSWPLWSVCRQNGFRILILRTLSDLFQILTQWPLAQNEGWHYFKLDPFQNEIPQHANNVFSIIFYCLSVYDEVIFQICLRKFLSEKWILQFLTNLTKNRAIEQHEPHTKKTRGWFQVLQKSK